MTENEEKVRRRAYEIWEREGRPEGLQDRHWDQARREIEQFGETEGAAIGSDAPAGKPAPESARPGTGDAAGATKPGGSGKARRQ